MTTIVNLTPHSLNVVDVDGNVHEFVSVGLARCQTTSVQVGTEEGFALTRTVYGEVEGLPEPAPGTLYVVSALVRLAVPSRTDVVSPGELVRDANKAVVGCRGFSVT